MTQDELIEKNMPLVWMVLKKYYRQCLNQNDAEDLFQVGCIWLVQAARRFDKNKGFAFSTYAVKMIWGQVARYLRDDLRIIKIPRSILDRYATMTEEEKSDISAMTSTVSLDSLIDPNDEKSPKRYEMILDQSVDVENDALCRITISEMLEALPDKYQITIRHSLSGFGQKECAKAVSCSQPQVSRIMRGFRADFEKQWNGVDKVNEQA